MVGLLEPLTFAVPFFGELTAVLLVWYLIGLFLLMVAAVILYVLASIENSLLGGSGGWDLGGGSQPEGDGMVDEFGNPIEEGYDDAGYEHEYDDGGDYGHEVVDDGGFEQETHYEEE